MSLDGVKEIFLKTGAPDVGVNPDAGYIYKWIEKVGSEHLYKGRDSAGNDFNIGTTGGLTQYFGTHGDHLYTLNNEGLEIGQPQEGAEVFLGKGSYYNEDIKVLDWNGSIYSDRTSDVLTEDANKLDFPNVNTGTALYFCSQKENTDYITHPGFRAKIDTAGNLGAGSIAFEAWNGTSWFEFVHSVAEANGHGRPGWYFNLVLGYRCSRGWIGGKLEDPGMWDESFSHRSSDPYAHFLCHQGHGG